MRVKIDLHDETIVSATRVAGISLRFGERDFQGFDRAHPQAFIASRAFVAEATLQIICTGDVRIGFHSPCHLDDMHHKNSLGANL
jgi:hypothetical protein